MKKHLIATITCSAVFAQSGLALSSSDVELSHWVIQPPATGVYTGVAAGPRDVDGTCSGVGRQVGQTMQFCVNNKFSIANLSTIRTDTRTAAMSAAGSIPILSLLCRGNGTPTSSGDVTFSAIGRGVEDTALQQDAVAVKAYAARFPSNPWVMIRPFHEFNLNIGNPRANPNKNNCFSMPESIGQMQAEFTEAFRHVVTYFASQGVTNVTWVWCPSIGPGLWPRFGDSMSGFYPGDAYVDWTCADTYDKPAPGGGVARAFRYIGFFTQFHKPLIIAETGECNSDEPRSPKCARYTVTQSAYISDIRSALQPGGALANAGVKAWLYFDINVPHSGFNWSFDGAGLSAFTALVNDPYFHPQMPHPRWTTLETQ